MVPHIQNRDEEWLKDMSSICPDYDDFTIRIRFRIPANKLNIENSEISAATSPNGSLIILKSADLSSPIKDSEWLVLVSDGWKTEQEAIDYSTVLLDLLCRSLSYHNLSADFGRRTPGGGFFRSYLDQLENKTGEKYLNDQRGIMIFPTAQKPKLARVGEPNVFISIPKEQWESTFQKAIKISGAFTIKESMAFDLLAMAHKVQQSADARFVLLFAAFETLLDHADRPKAVQDHVEKLIEETEKANLPDSEKKSLAGTLKWLRNYSIRTTGRQFVKYKLGDSMFGGYKAEDLFLECYELRNRLLHGQTPYAEWRDVSRLAAAFEQMVAKLLSGNLA